MKRRTVPLYGAWVFFSEDRQECRDYIRKHSADAVEGDPVGTALGMCYDLEDKKGGHHRIMAVFDGKLQTLVHESVHMSWMILDHCGVEIEADNNEPQAYIAEWLVTRFMRDYKIKVRP